MRPVTVSITVPQQPRGGLRVPRRLANHEPFTDHMMVDWHYSGPAAGLGARARMRLKKARPPGPAWTSRSSRSNPPTTSVEESCRRRRPRRTRGTYILEEARRRAGRGSRSASSWLSPPLIERLAAPLTRSVLRRGNQRSLERLPRRLTLVPQP